MSVPHDTYNKPPMSLTLDDIRKYSETGEYCRVESPLLNVLLDHIILDELHLLLRFTDVLLSNLIEDAMELDDKDDFCKKRGEPKGIHLRKLTQLINSCGVTFSVWEKKNMAMEKGWGKWTGHHLWVMRKRSCFVTCQQNLENPPTPFTQTAKTRW